MGGAYEQDSRGSIDSGIMTVTSSSTAVRKYYLIAGLTMAMLDSADQPPNLKYLLTDHLGSVVAVTDATGSLISQQRYLPFGQVRTDLPTPPNSSIAETDFGYTGQRSLNMGLMDYRARMYDPTIGRFIQPDSIIPSYGNPPNLNRYAYGLNNPVKYTDPTGHDPWWDDPDFYYADLKTYIAASIAVQNSSPLLRPAGLIRALGERYTGIGPGNITDAQMETPLGKAIIDDKGNNRGYGLGMRSEPCGITGCTTDQSNADVANVAMGRRIQLVLNNCTNCSETDRYIAAALAGNGPGFTQAQMKDVVAKGRLPSGTLNWDAYLNNQSAYNDQYDRMLIKKFDAQVNKLRDQGWYVPPINQRYISRMY